MSYIYPLGNDKFANISDDETIAVIDPKSKIGELYPEMLKFLKEASENNGAIAFVEVQTTISILRRILKEFSGEEGAIRFGVSPKQNHGAALMRVSNAAGRIVVVAGRSEV